jgi:predicted transcriptional regulator
MSTSLKLPPKLKSRVAAASKKAGKSPHAFMLEAIERQTTLAERREQFVAEALEAEKDAVATGLGLAAEDVHAYAQARARGHKPRKPKAGSWRG